MIKRAYIIGEYVASAPGPPRDYYIAEGGTGDGLTSGAPGPLSMLTSALMVSNDNVFLNRGDEFDFSDFLLGGINDVTFQAFGTGADPILTGSNSLTGSVWNDNGDGTWWLALAEEPKWVWINGTAARLAESSWYQIDAAPSVGTRSIAAATLAGLATVVGAKAVFKQFDFRASTLVTVVTEDDSTGNFTFSPPFTDNGYAAIGMSVKFINQAQFLTTAGDWWYDSVNQKLFVKSVTTPAGTDIRITTGNFGFIITNSDRISFDGIEMRHFYKSHFEVHNSDDLSITNCNLHDGRNFALRIYGTSADFIFEDNTTERFGANGLGLLVAGASIKRNSFDEIGTLANINYPFDANLHGGSSISILGPTSDVDIDENIFDNQGSAAIQIMGIDFQITRNQCYTTGTKWNDGGAIYTVYRAGSGPGTYNGLIQSNIIDSGFGDITGTSHTAFWFGIYIDNGCNGIIVDKNSIDHIRDAAIISNWDCKENTFTDNHAIGDLYAMRIREDTDVADSPIWQYNVGNVVTGNIFASRRNSQHCFDATSLNGLTTFNPFSSGGNSNNNHYVYPYLNYVNSYHTQEGAIFLTNYDLPGWQTKMGLDGSSTQRINYITFSSNSNAEQEVKMEFNPTASAVNFNVPAGYSDYAGVAFTNPVSIPAYGSLIYFKNTAYP